MYSRSKKRLSPRNMTLRRTYTSPRRRTFRRRSIIQDRPIKHEGRAIRNLYVPKYNFPNPTTFTPIVKCRKINTTEDYTSFEKSLIIDYIHNRKFYDTYQPHFKIPTEIQYIDTDDKRRRTLEIELNLHHGQRKLLFSVLKCILRLVPDTNKKIIICYAGAAPGQNIAWILELFPTIEIWCYGPNPFAKALLDHSRAKCFNTIFTDELAIEWSSRDCDIFISDIRTSHLTREQFNNSVANDNAMQLG